jgi:hypothetical protein
MRLNAWYSVASHPKVTFSLHPLKPIQTSTITSAKRFTGIFVEQRHQEIKEPEGTQSLGNGISRLASTSTIEHAYLMNHGSPKSRRLGSLFTNHRCDKNLDPSLVSLEEHMLYTLGNQVPICRISTGSPSQRSLDPLTSAHNAREVTTPHIMDVATLFYCEASAPSISGVPGPLDRGATSLTAYEVPALSTCIASENYPVEFRLPSPTEPRPRLIREIRLPMLPEPRGFT